MRSKLSYANVMSTIAVFLVLGGAAVAANQLPKNSVGPRQLKKNAVKTGHIARNAVKVGKLDKEAVKAGKLAKNAVPTNRIRNNAVTGAKVNESTLGVVPTANVANSANALSPPEATHFVGLPGEPPFESGSGNFPPGEGFNFQPVGFYKDHEGIVHLEGFAKAPEEIIFTLPPGYRPASGINQILAVGGVVIFVSGPGATYKGKDASGKVISNGEQAVLSGLTFRAES